MIVYDNLQTASNMASGLLSRLCRAFQTFEQAIDIILGRGFPPGALCSIESSSAINGVQSLKLPGQSSIKDIVNDAIVWGAPKQRRTLEKRLNRKFGWPKYNWKPLVPKTNILTCRKCGHDYEAGLLCSYCYEIVKKETEQMQEAIQKELGLCPVEQDVIVLYEGEKREMQDDFWKKQRIVELPKKRPDWFDKNLLQPSTKKSSDETSVVEIKSKDIV